MLSDSKLNLGVYVRHNLLVLLNLPSDDFQFRNIIHYYNRFSILYILWTVFLIMFDHFIYKTFILCKNIAAFSSQIMVHIQVKLLYSLVG